jgi:hypothetical protein
MVRQDDYVKALVVTECWRQGKDFGNHQIPTIIAGCLANRVRLGWGSWLDVLKKIPNFSAVLVQPNRDLLPDIWEPNFVKLLHNIDGIYDGSIADPAMGGIYWADLSKGKAGITNQWFQEKIIDSPAHLPCANQGPFTIFR